MDFFVNIFYPILLGENIQKSTYLKMSWVEHLSVLSQLKTFMGTTPDNFSHFTTFTHLDKSLID